MTGSSNSKKNSSESNFEEQLKELKELLHETKNEVTSLEKQITNNHNKLLEKIIAANNNAKQALQLTGNNEILISKLRHENQAPRKKYSATLQKVQRLW